MATAPVVVDPAKTENSFERFIDKVKAVFVKVDPIVDTIAVAAEPFLALTPEGPEYTLAVNAIISAKQVAEASIAAGVNLTGAQKLALAVQAATPGLNAILTSKGVTTDTQTHVDNWIQLVFNVLAGPVGKLVSQVHTA